MNDKLVDEQVNESVKQILKVIRHSSTATAEVSLESQEDAIEMLLRAALRKLGVEE